MNSFLCHSQSLEHKQANTFQKSNSWGPQKQLLSPCLLISSQQTFQKKHSERPKKAFKDTKKGIQRHQKNQQRFISNKGRKQTQAAASTPALFCFGSLNAPFPKGKEKSILSNCLSIKICNKLLQLYRGERSREEYLSGYWSLLRDVVPFAGVENLPSLSDPEISAPWARGDCCFLSM